jgi:hypothetical protein
MNYTAVIDDMISQLEGLRMELAGANQDRIARKPISNASNRNGLGRSWALGKWQQAIAILRDGAFKDRRDDFDKYLRPLKLKHLSESSVELIAPNSIISEWIAVNALTDIDDILDDILGRDVNVIIDVEQEVEA